MTGYPEINHLVLAADAAVLDYSSLRFDVALARRPMVFLVPDLARYERDVRGFLYDFRSSAPGPLLDDTDGVVVRAARPRPGSARRRAVRRVQRPVQRPAGRPGVRDGWSRPFSAKALLYRLI